MVPVRSTRVSADALISVFLLAATVAFFVSLPHHLGSADESYFLYEARRIREGEVMYRDFFQFVTPGAWYVMALLYWLFGTTMATARIGMAMVYGLTGVASYAAARTIGVRREIAIVLPLAYVAICQPAWPVASPHWFSTLVIAVLLFTALRDDGAARRSFVLGVEVGILIAVQQQRGAIMAVGIATLTVVEELIRLAVGDFSFRVLVQRMLSLAFGVALAVVPIFGTLIYAAGWGPLYRDLFFYPVFEYSGGVTATWGAVTVISFPFAKNTWPIVLKYLPLVIVVPVLRSAALLWARRSDQLRVLITLIVFVGFSVLSTMYNADFIHIAFIAPVMFVTLSESVEWILRLLPSPRLTRAAAWAVAVVLAVPMGRQLYDNAVWAWNSNQYPHETAFGWIEFNAPWEPVFIDDIRKRIAQTPSHELFCYPHLASPYLTTGGKNPTPYQHLSLTQSPAHHLQEAIAILRDRKVPYIVTAPLYVRPGDPIQEFIDAEYEFVPTPDIAMTGQLPRLWLFARRNAPPLP